MSADRESRQELVISRVFDAPRELVFRAWTEPEHLMQWCGPKGYTMLASKMDLRPGGLFHYGLRSPKNQEMWGIFVYREILAPERIAFISSFADEKGQPIRNPHSPSWPLEILNTLTFLERRGKTTLTLRGRPHSATQTEIETFRAAQAGVQRGFKGTLDQLEAYLATRTRP